MSNITEFEAVAPAGPDAIKTKLTRAWSDLSPKLYAFLISGTAATALITGLDTYLNVALEPGLAALIVTVAASVVAYFKSDTVILGAGRTEDGELTL